MSFLEKEDEKQSSFWDWVIGIALVLAIGGFTVYYQYQKRSSTARSAQADSLFTAGKFREAAKVYEELKNAQYLTPKHDSIIYARLDTIETAREEDAARVMESKSRLLAGDTAGAEALISALRAPDLLSTEDRAWVDSALPSSVPAQSPGASATGASAEGAEGPASSAKAGP
jgi:hypothetical protein